MGIRPLVPKLHFTKILPYNIRKNDEIYGIGCDKLHIKFIPYVF
jgi:hypothetical protein